MFRAALLSAWHVHADEYYNALNNMEGAEVAVIWDENEERGKAFAEKYGKPFEPDYKAILAREDIDGVIVVSATKLHKEIIIAAAKAGKHIFTEKVLASTIEEAKEIKEAVVSSGVKFCISLPHMTMPGNIYAKKAIDDGILGQITYVRIRNAHNGATGGWLPERFFSKDEAQGGAMLDLGAHPMYLIRWFLGRPKSVVSVFTAFTNHEVEDNAISAFEFANGAAAVSETGFVTSASPYSVEIYGTDGTILIGGADNNVKIKHKDDGNRGFTVVEDLADSGKSAMCQWFDAVTKGEPVAFDIELACTLTEIMDYAYRSHNDGKKVYFE